MSFELIRKQKEDLVSLKEEIMCSDQTLAEKCVASVSLFPSQVYGMLIKDLIKEQLNSVPSENADGYTDEYGSFKVKVCVAGGNTAKLKQVIFSEFVSTYILVYLNYNAETVGVYAIPRNIIMANISSKPDHGDYKRGHSNEFTAFLNVDDLGEYLIEV